MIRSYGIAEALQQQQARRVQRMRGRGRAAPLGGWLEDLFKTATTTAKSAANAASDPASIVVEDLLKSSAFAKVEDKIATKVEATVLQTVGIHSASLGLLAVSAGAAGGALLGKGKVGWGVAAGLALFAGIRIWATQSDANAQAAADTAAARAAEAKLAKLVK